MACPPTTSAFAQTARPLSVFPRGKTDHLKGGVNFKSVREPSNPPCQGGFFNDLPQLRFVPHRIRFSL